MQQVGKKDDTKPYNPDGIKFIDPELPSEFNFCGWMKRPWGGQCHVHNDIASYSYNKFQEREPCILFQKAWLTIAAFKIIKLKELHEKEVEYKKNLHERASNL